MLHADPLVITQIQKKPPTETLTLNFVRFVFVCVRRHVSLPTLWVCVSLPSSVCLLQGPCLSLTKRGSLCPLLPAEETDTSHHTHPYAFTSLLLSVLSLCVFHLLIPVISLILFIFLRLGLTVALLRSHTGGSHLIPSDQLRLCCFVCDGPSECVFFRLTTDWVSWIHVSDSVSVPPWSLWEDVWLRGCVQTHTMLRYLSGVSDVINEVVWYLSFNACTPSQDLLCVCVCASEFVVFIFIAVPEALSVCVSVCMWGRRVRALTAAVRIFTTFITVQSKQVCLPLRNTNDTPHTKKPMKRCVACQLKWWKSATDLIN